MSEPELPADARQAATEIREALSRFNISDEQIFPAVPEYDDSASTPTEAIGSYIDGMYSTSGGVTASQLTDTMRDILAWSDYSITTDHTYHHQRNLAGPLNTRVADFGYEVVFEAVGAEEWVEPDSPHPRAFRVVLTELTTGDTHQMAFRYPPKESTHRAANHLGALAAALNDTVLSEAGLRLVKLPLEMDSYNFLLIGTDKLADLTATYGERLEVFGEPLIRRTPKYGGPWKRTVEAAVRDHKTEFGVPEPSDTYKVEEAHDMENPTEQVLW